MRWWHPRGAAAAADRAMGRARAQAVLFLSRNTALVCVGRGWYQVQASGGGVEARKRPPGPAAGLLRLRFPAGGGHCADDRRQGCHSHYCRPRRGQ